MQIIKRHSMFYNVVFYSLLSILTVHVTLALLMEMSAFNIALFYEQFKSSSFIMLLIMLFALFVISAMSYSKISLYLYYLASLAMVGFLLVSLYGNFNKAVLFIIFFYCVLAYFLGQGWKQTLCFACYNPHISDKDLDYPTPLRINAKIKIKKDKVYESFFTNWDEISCFVRFEDKNEDKLRGNVKIIAEYNGRQFENWGKIVSCVKNKGIGIIFDMNRGKKFNWRDFYNIMEEVSFTPEYLIQ